MLLAFAGAAWGQSPSPLHKPSPAAAARKRSALFLARRGVGRPGQGLPAEILMHARAQHAAILRNQAQAQAQTPSPTWQPVGPMQVNTPQWGLVTGRVTSLAADPWDSTGNTLYVGTTGAGVWKSTNAASQTLQPAFLPLTDDLGALSSASLASLSVGAVTVQPGGTGVILAGTGDPNDATDSWYGAGILRSADGGATWTLVSQTTPTEASHYQEFSFAGNAFAGFAWSTTNPGVVVAAVTQSAYAAVLSAAGSNSILGLYYSQDAGVTWQMAVIEDGSALVQSPQMTGIMGGNAATAVVWDSQRQSFYAAVRYHGYYQSPDGVTWTRLANQPGTNLTTALCPPDSGVPGSPACPIFRGALAAQPASGDLFALTVDENNLDQGLWQDVCNLTAGACASPTVQFGTEIADQPLDSVSGDGTIADGDYNLWLAAVQSQQDTLLFAGTTDLWKCSLANSCVWRNATNTQTCAAAMVAPAQHAVDSTFGSSGLMYFGNDGGLWRTVDAVAQQATTCSSDDASHFQNLNGGLGSLAEVESFSEDPNNPATWLAALGALGTAAPQGQSQPWDQVLDGEGNVVAIDPMNPDTWYATSIFGVGINQCTQGAECNTAAFGDVAIGEAQVDGDEQTIPAAWMLDPADTSNVILGTCRIWRGAGDGSGWGAGSLLSGILDGDQTTPVCNGNAQVRSLAAGVNLSGGVLPGAEQIYAGMAGALDGGGGLAPGHVFTAPVTSASTAATASWVDLYPSPVVNPGEGGRQFNPGGFSVSSVYADPHDATGQTIYVTVQGYSTPLWTEPVLYMSTDAGAHWTNITSDLPDAPANSVVVDPNSPAIVYVATDTGVYATQNVGNCAASPNACWNAYGSGLPDAPVIALMTYNEGTTQVLRAATYGRGIWEIALATAGITPTTASAVPASLTFAAQPENTASPAQTVTVTDTGTLNLNIASVSIDADFSETDTCRGQSLAPRGNCALQVVFDPTTTGTRTGTLTLMANVAGGEIAVPLSGTGTTPPDIVLNPASLSFGDVAVGTASPVQTVTISNTGGEAANLTSETASSGFTITANTCGANLAANTGCSVSIAFSPAASGTVSGTFVVVDALGTQTVQLSGTGQSVATDSLSPLSLAFGAQQVGTVSATQTLTLTNGGDQALTEIALSVTGDFTAVNNCGTLLQGHGSCSISVSYAPAQTGPETGTLTVSDELRQQAVALSGTGVAPPGASATPDSVNFGGYGVGATSNPQMVTVTNNGGYTLTALAAAVSAGFSISSNTCPATLSVDANCQIAITFTAPSSAGAVTGTLTISAGNLKQPLTVSLAGAAEDFSLAVTGSSSAVITSGQTASFAFALQGLGGTSGSVALSCSGAPQDSTCSFGLPKSGSCPATATATLAIDGSNSSSAALCLATGVPVSTQTAAAGRPWTRNVPLFAVLLPALAAGIRRRRWAGMMVLALAMLWLPSGCGVSASSGAPGGGGGGGGTTSPQSGTPAGTYPITVTATLANVAHGAQVSLTVQ